MACACTHLTDFAASTNETDAAFSVDFQPSRGDAGATTGQPCWCRRPAVAGADRDDAADRDAGTCVPARRADENNYTGAKSPATAPRVCGCMIDIAFHSIRLWRCQTPTASSPVHLRRRGMLRRPHCPRYTSDPEVPNSGSARPFSQRGLLAQRRASAGKPPVRRPSTSVGDARAPTASAASRSTRSPRRRRGRPRRASRVRCFGAVAGLVGAPSRARGLLQHSLARVRRRWRQRVDARVPFDIMSSWSPRRASSVIWEPARAPARRRACPGGPTAPALGSPVKGTKSSSL